MAALVGERNGWKPEMSELMKTFIAARVHVSARARIHVAPYPSEMEVHLFRTSGPRKPEVLQLRRWGRSRWSVTAAPMPRRGFAKVDARVDVMSVAELSGYLKVHWPAIRERLLARDSIIRYRYGGSKSTSPGGRTSSEFPVCSIASSSKRCCRYRNRSLRRHSRNSVTDSGRGARRIRPWRWRKPPLPKAVSGWSILTWKSF